MNRSGPRHEPWGIPQVIILAEDLCPLTVQNCFLFCKYDINQSPAIPLTPYFSNFANKIVWSTVSNAFFRSRKMARFTSPLSIVSYQESELFIKDVIVEYNFLKAACLCVRIGWRNSNIWSCTIFSKILEKIAMTEIGL